MKPQKFGILLFSAAGLFLLIVDSHTAAAGVREGLELCIRTLIPSLFPFMFLAMLLNSYQSDKFLEYAKKSFMAFSPICLLNFPNAMLRGYIPQRIIK